jgi:predicted enzyme involved in methoxymalonyl-ACP biosynthesis
MESIGDARIVKVSVHNVRSTRRITSLLYRCNVFAVDYNRYLASGEISNMLECYI